MESAHRESGVQVILLGGFIGITPADNVMV